MCREGAHIKILQIGSYQDICQNEGVTCQKVGAGGAERGATCQKLKNFKNTPPLTK